jgi:hypothetical protein
MAEQRQLGNRFMNWGNPSEWEGGQNPDEKAEWGRGESGASMFEVGQPDNGQGWEQPDPLSGRSSGSPRENFGGAGQGQAPDVALRATGANPGQPFGSGAGDDGMSAQGPRERPVPDLASMGAPGLDDGDGGVSATPARPRTPMPEGGVFTAPGAVSAHAAMPGVSGGGIGTRLKGLFGGAGGLTGGGLGLPMQSANPAQSDPISSLLSNITSKRRIIS